MNLGLSETLQKNFSNIFPFPRPKIEKTEIKHPN